MRLSPVALAGIATCCLAACGVHRRYDLRGGCDLASVERSIMDVLNRRTTWAEVIDVDGLPEHYLLVLTFGPIQNSEETGMNVLDGFSRFIVDTRRCMVIDRVYNPTTKSAQEELERHWQEAKKDTSSRGGY